MQAKSNLPQINRRQLVPIAVALACIAAFVVGSSAQPSDIPSAKTILKAWDDHTAKIKSGKFVWTHTQEMPRALLYMAAAAPKVVDGIHVSEFRCTFRFDRDKARLDLSGNAPSLSIPALEHAPFETIWAFDGKKTRELSLPTGPRKSSQGTLHGERDQVSEHVWVAQLMWNLRPRQVIPGIAKWEIGSAKDDDGRAFITMSEPKGEFPADRSQRVFWLDPTKDYAITKCVHSERATKKRVSQTDLSLARDKSAGWIPSSWVIEQLGANGQSSKITAKMLERTINAGTENTNYAIEFPPGTLIIDQSKADPGPVKDRKK